MKKREQDLVKAISDRLKNYDMYEKLYEEIKQEMKKHLKKKR